MTGSAVDASFAGLQTAIQTAVGAFVTVGFGFPTDMPDTALFVAGGVSDWRQTWEVTPQGQPLVGERDETFVLQVFAYRRKLGATLLEIMPDIRTMRLAVETALRVDHTLGGALSSSGMAQLESAQLDESLADDRTRELGLTMSIRCDAVIT